MELTIDIQERPGHLLCQVNGDFTPENVMTVLNRILSACARGQERHVLVDLTGVPKGAAASVKVIAGMEATETLTTFADTYGSMPKIAVLGQPPLITTYRPAEDFLKGSGIPVAVFTDSALAYKWLSV